MSRTEEEVKRDLLFLACARAAHEVNRAYCIAIGDSSQPSWEQAPEWQVVSALEGVRGVLVDNNDARQSHENWLRQKRLDGWVQGSVKNPETKEHPCMVEYDDLPEEQKRKDIIFVSTVRLMAAALNFYAQPSQ